MRKIVVKNFGPLKDINVGKQGVPRYKAKITDLKLKFEEEYNTKLYYSCHKEF